MATANGRGGRMCQSYECVDVCNVSVRWSRKICVFEMEDKFTQYSDFGK